MNDIVKKISRIGLSTMLILTSTITARAEVHRPEVTVDGNKTDWPDQANKGVWASEEKKDLLIPIEYNFLVDDEDVLFPFLNIETRIGCGYYVNQSNIDKYCEILGLDSVNYESNGEHYKQKAEFEEEKCKMSDGCVDGFDKVVESDESDGYEGRDSGGYSFHFEKVKKGGNKKAKTNVLIDPWILNSVRWTTFSPFLKISEKNNSNSNLDLSGYHKHQIHTIPIAGREISYTNDNAAHYNSANQTVYYTVGDKCDIRAVILNIPECLANRNGEGSKKITRLKKKSNLDTTLKYKKGYGEDYYHNFTIVNSVDSIRENGKEKNVKYELVVRKEKDDLHPITLVTYGDNGRNENDRNLIYIYNGSEEHVGSNSQEASGAVKLEYFDGEYKTEITLANDGKFELKGITNREDIEIHLKQDDCSILEAQGYAGIPKSIDCEKFFLSPRDDRRTMLSAVDWKGISLNDCTVNEATKVSSYDRSGVISINTKEQKKRTYFTGENEIKIIVSNNEVPALTGINMDVLPFVVIGIVIGMYAYISKKRKANNF